MRPIYLISKEDLYKLYISQEYSIQDIAKFYNCGRNTIRYWLKKYNILSRKVGNKGWTKRSYQKLNQSLSGSNNPNWKGGISCQTRNRRCHNKQYRIWRQTILQRDNWICQNCFNSNRRLEIHHIYPYKKFPNLQYIPWNGITLCRDCHKKVKNREIQTINYFLNLQQKLYEGGFYEWN